MEIQVVEDNFYGVVALVSNVLLTVVYHDIRTEPMHEINAIFPLPRVNSSLVENFGQLDSNETRANLANRQDRGFRGPGAPLPADTASWSLQRWGSGQPSSTTMRKV